MRRWGNWVSIIVCTAIAVLPLVPPMPDGDEYSVDRAMGHIQEIARSPHPIGSAENERVRSYLIATLANLGLSPQTQTVATADYFGAPGTTVDVVNVIARIEGSGTDQAVALVAHSDTVPETAGANDNSSSVAILLEVAGALTAGDPPTNDVVLLFTDGEEPAPRFGSRAFVDGHPWSDDVAFVVNLEASGTSGGSILAETSGPTGWLIRGLAESAEYPLAFSFFTDIASSIGGFGTDFDPFREAGVPGVGFAYLHGSPVYHTAGDSIENVGLRSVQHQGANVLALTRFLAQGDLSPPPDASDSVFFTVGRWTVIRYPAAWSVPLAVVALILLGAAVFRYVGPGRWFKAFALTLAGFLGAAVAGAVGWMLITAIRTTPGILESYGYLAALLAATGGLWHVLALRRDPKAMLAAVVGVWTVLALCGSPLVPGVSYLFTWPAIVGSLAVLAWPVGSRWSVPSVSLVSLVVCVPILDFLFQMAQPRPGNPDSEMIPLAGGVTAIAFLLIGLISSTSRNPVTHQGGTSEDELYRVGADGLSA
jgi:hypothetical protein